MRKIVKSIFDDAYYFKGKFFARSFSGSIDELANSVGSRLVPTQLSEGTLTLPDLEGGGLILLESGNVVYLCAGAEPLPRRSLKFECGASKNLVIIGARSRLPTELIFQGNGNLCIFGEDINWPNEVTVRFSSDNGGLLWGKGATSNGTEIILEGEGRIVHIGDDCMFARGTSVRTSDLHAIYDSDDNLLNPSTDVSIADHCWIGLDAVIAKGVHIGAGSIVAARSFVTRDVAARSLVAGTPAKQVRQQIRWERHRPGSTDQK